MSFQSKESIEIELQALLEHMDVPEDRKHDLHWLSRNLGIRNRKNIHFQDALTAVAALRLLNLQPLD